VFSQPADFYHRPAPLRAARFFGATNEIPGTLAGTAFTCAAGELHVAAGGRDGSGVLVVRPEALRLRSPATAPNGVVNTLAAIVTGVRFRGSHHSVGVQLRGGVHLTATVPPALRLEPGDEVSVELPPAACQVLPPEGPPQRVPAIAHARMHP
jgi:putative spermidine/putrescine transport system ATP-binding protein